MKKLIVIITLSNILLFSQTSKEEKLEWIKSRGDIKVTETENDIYRFEYLGGRIHYYYLGKTETYQTDTIPTTVIDPWNVDTTLYHEMYSFWQEVPVAAPSKYKLTISDVNNNGYPEIYGHVKDYDDPLSRQIVHIFEMDSTGLFLNKYKYPDSTIIAHSIYDIDKDGNEEVYLAMNNGRDVFYKQENSDELPTVVDFIFSLYQGQQDDPKLDDFDKNGIVDFLFYENSPRGPVICEYNNAINNFKTVAEFVYQTGFYQGFAYGDFDLDGKTDIVYESLDGEVFVIEAEGEHIYSLVWEKDIVGFTSYMQIFTNDIDKNSKPEFWVSSTTSNGSADITRFTCFEYSVDNVYEEIHRIDFVGVYPFYAGNAFSS